MQRAVSSVPPVLGFLNLPTTLPKATSFPRHPTAKHDLETYLNLLGVDGKYVIVGVPPDPFSFNSFSIIASECPVGAVATAW